MISIVDDDPSVRVALDGLVRSVGYRVATFASAEEFLQSDQVGETSCLISDVQMPGLDGLELQSALIARGNRTPLIFVTAYRDERVRHRALEAGAAGFLTKPIDETRLIEHLQSAVQTHDGGEQS
jgi:FixJ family two-component response regulator